MVIFISINFIEIKRITFKWTHFLQYLQRGKRERLLRIKPCVIAIFPAPILC